MIDYIVCLVETFQTLIVGTLGFAGVIFTMYTNAKISREQTQAVIAHERDTFRAAIECELGTIKEMFEVRAKDFADGSGRSIILPEAVPINIYKSLQTKIGLLEPEEIKLIMRAYLLIEELEIRLKVLSRQSDDSTAYEGYIHIGKEHMQIAGEMHANFLTDINGALDAISQ